MKLAVFIVRSALAGLGAFHLFNQLLLRADHGMNWRLRINIAAALGVLLITGMLLEDLGA